MPSALSQDAAPTSSILHAVVLFCSEESNFCKSIANVDVVASYNLIMFASDATIAETNLVLY